MTRHAKGMGASEIVKEVVGIAADVDVFTDYETITDEIGD